MLALHSHKIDPNEARHKGEKMPVCVPIRDLKDTAKFSNLIENENEVIVTKNGYTAFRCLSEEKYHELEMRIARAELKNRMDIAKHEIETGKYSPFDEFLETL